MSAPVANVWSTMVPDAPAGRTYNIQPFILIRKSIVLAENEPTSTESETTKENRDQTPESGAQVKENRSNTSNDAETKPLKPFKPSEEIAAEQAVDFPVDI